jgi:hypothetical protein
MGYTHYWRRPAIIPEPAIRSIVADFESLILPLDDAGIRLGDGQGSDIPVITLDGVYFNGLSSCGHLQGSEISIRRHWAGANKLKSNSTAYFCDGDCSHETFAFPRTLTPPAWQEPRNGLCQDSCKTAFRTFDVAVTAFLLMATHHHPLIEVSTDGEDEKWEDARNFCQSALGFGSEYRINAMDQTVEVRSCEIG